MEAGRYQAKIVDYGVWETKAGDPKVFIQFEIPTGERITWQGSLSQKASEYTLRTLITCGLSTVEISVLAEGMQGAGLDVQTPLSITVQNQTGTDGKERMVVRWINKLSGQAFENRLSKEAAHTKLSGFQADLVRLMKEAGVTTVAQTEKGVGF